MVKDPMDPETAPAWLWLTLAAGVLATVKAWSVMLMTTPRRLRRPGAKSHRRPTLILRFDAPLTAEDAAKIKQKVLAEHGWDSVLLGKPIVQCEVIA